MSKNIRVYRFFNLDRNEHGQPFAECDDHIEEYKRKRKPAAPQLILEKIADEAVWPCNKCDSCQSSNGGRGIDHREARGNVR